MVDPTKNIDFKENMELGDNDVLFGLSVDSSGKPTKAGHFKYSKFKEWIKSFFTPYEKNVGDMKLSVEQTVSDFNADYTQKKSELDNDFINKGNALSQFLDEAATKIDKDVQTTEDNKNSTNQDKIDVQALLKQVQDLKKEVEGYRNEMNLDTFIKKASFTTGTYTFPGGDYAG